MAGGVRIVSGRLKGRRLATPAGLGTRPTADRVREAVFSILYGRIAGARVLDLFSGSGALALEAISRGAQSALAIDRDPAAISVIRRNITHCGVDDRAAVIGWDIRASLDCLSRRPETYSLIFLDPPYASDLAGIAMAHLHAAGCVSPGATLVVEHSQQQIPEAIEGFCMLTDRRRYGKTLVSFFTTML
ncbi:MAG: 16S rRNA (guanine(966)-N(2))-methyltransferase RsmD [Pseudomonadota bacterium]